LTIVVINFLLFLTCELITFRVLLQQYLAVTAVSTAVRGWPVCTFVAAVAIGYSCYNMLLLLLLRCHLQGRLG
jgi:hypothetical protein